MSTMDDVSNLKESQLRPAHALGVTYSFSFFSFFSSFCWSFSLSMVCRSGPEGRQVSHAARSVRVQRLVYTDNAKKETEERKVMTA